MFRVVVIILVLLSFALGGYLAKSNLFVSGETAYEHKDYAVALGKLKKEDTPRAEYYLGCMYFDGLGVPMNRAEAARWFEKSAGRGFSDAQFSLGSMASTGEGVPQDKAAAVRWYRLAAEQGNTKAMFNLGIMYGTGNGVRMDRVEALRLIRNAATLGNGNAREALRKLTGAEN